MTTNNPTTDVRQMLEEGTFLEFIEATNMKGNIAEAVIAGRRVGRPITARSVEEVARGWDRLISECNDLGVEVPGEPGVGWLGFKRECILEGILGQIIEHDLAEAVEAAFDEDTRQDYIDQADSELGLEWLVEVVEPVDGYRCGVTGEHRTGKAVLIQPRWFLDRMVDGATLPILISPEVVASLDLA